MSALLTLPIEQAPGDYSLLDGHEMPVDEMIRCLCNDAWPSATTCKAFGLFGVERYDVAQFLIKQEIVQRDDLMAVEGQPALWETFIAKARLSHLEGTFTD